MKSLSTKRVCGSKTGLRVRSEESGSRRTSSRNKQQRIVKSIEVNNVVSVILLYLLQKHLPTRDHIMCADNLLPHVTG